MVASEIGVDLSAMSRNRAGPTSVRCALCEQVELVIGQYDLIGTVLGKEAYGADLERELRIEIDACKGMTTGAAADTVAQRLGIDTFTALRKGTGSLLESKLDQTPDVATQLSGHLKRLAVSKVNCSRGRRAEKEDLDSFQARSGTTVRSRNSNMMYARVYVSPNVAADIGGRVDGVSSDECGDYLVESKRRVSRFLGIPEHERIQMELYMRLFGVRRCLHTETLGDEHRDRWINPDDVLLRTIVDELQECVRSLMLLRCMPAVGARTVAVPWERWRTQAAQDTSFDLTDPTDDLTGLWTKAGNELSGDE